MTPNDWLSKRRDADYGPHEAWCDTQICNPEGRASFEGSQGDKDIFNQGFEKFKAWRRGEG